jgi:hypothetical protein
MHGFRHYLRTELALKGVDKKVRNMITGHEGTDESEKYEHYDLDAMVKALKLLPDPYEVRPEIEEAVLAELDEAA